ncbi:penicillin-binding transpeptidase domain-containing protein [Paenibacillus mendelii]|uniref:Penicillin-binding transpeptidase domain-containing protein n=1 Tax=Paenibacillus mendelii TaxID=206163 RepID=A0ABV6JEA8_9BACL|nr:penicillin-binding transpeptidase domain-containing protein [Paenibacillus mendelii]MCQ6557128.1 penicillin-binding transpeptidase domain-containing protein [Paenibacillus mendelii]
MGKLIKRRSLVLGLFLSLIFVVLIAKVFWVQVVDADKYVAAAQKYWLKSEILPAQRGEILDRNSVVLSRDVPAYNVTLNPDILIKLGMAEEVAGKLSSILSKDKTELLEGLYKKRENGSYYISRDIRPEGVHIDKKKAELVLAYKESLQKKLSKKKNVKNVDVGIYIFPTAKRFYPNESLAAQLIGFVDLDKKASGGIESAFDTELSGTAGIYKYYRDGNGIGIDAGEVLYKPELDGSQIMLTIDTNIQFFVEQALNKVVETYEPKSATVIVADPSTMDILALANRPTYNPNQYWEVSDYASFYNHAIMSEYEPGSTFKIVTLAAAIEEGLFDPYDKYQSGSISVPGKIIHDVKREGWGRISYLEGLKRSSNVAFVNLGYKKLGADRLTDYIKKFGFGEKTNIELNGEGSGVLKMKYPADYAAASYGQGRIQVTPMQQVAAVAAVANGGKLMEPHIIKQIVRSSDNMTIATKPKFIRQVISSDTAKLAGDYLEQVVSDRKLGSGKYAAIEGIRVAGKTGTANKVINGAYAKGKHVVSFIGYAPVENPKVVVLVIVDEPKDELGGGTVAAPVFKEIVSQTLTYMGVHPTSQPTTSPSMKGTIKVSELQGKRIEEAKKRIGQDSTITVLGKGSTVLDVFPSTDFKPSEGNGIYLITEKIENIPLPDMTGLSLVDAINLSSLYKCKVITTGEGYVVSQKVSGSDGNRTISLQLKAR